MAEKIVLDFKEYLDRVEGCWLGKAIGGTLGGPHEGKLHVLDLDYYRPVPNEAAPNDDLDLQLVWLAMMEQTGVPLRLSHLADWWLRCLMSYPWSEYGFCTRNLSRGLRPPISGCFENYFVDEMGSPIRSEIWACLAPGDPQRAAEMAWKDSALDHSGAEGMHGEMFWAAVQSAAFVESDPEMLLQIGLNMIPVHSQISRAVREAMRCHRERLPWAEARETIRRGFVFGDAPRACYAPINHGFTVLGWLYGEDFGDRLCKAVNCAFDTDCTGATLGALLGILGGTKAIPEKWRGPVGERIVLHKFTKLPEAPRTIPEAAQRTAKLARKIAAEGVSDAFEFGRKTELPPDIHSRLMRNELALEARARDVHAAVEDRGDIEVTLHYGGEPVIWPGIKKVVGVSLAIEGEAVAGDIEIEMPNGWAVQEVEPRFGQRRFALLAKNVSERNMLSVHAKAAGRSQLAAFAILGPGEAKGYPVLKNVPTCARCGAWEEACVCARQ